MTSPLRVLSIEDNAGDARLVVEQLTQAGLSAHIYLVWADRLATGLEQIVMNPPEAVLLDLSLPDSSGLETLERVLEAAPSIPVIVMTGMADEVVAVQAVQSGAQDYLIKGQMDGRLLFRAIRHAMERKRVELHLRELAAIVDNSTDVIFRKDLQGIIRSWNKGAEQIYGYSPEEVIGKPVSILMPPELTGQMPEILEKIKRGEKVEHFETERLRKDGARITLSITVSPIYDDQGQVIAASTIAHDVTEKKRAQQAIQRIQDRFRALTENAPDGVALIDKDGQMKFVSPAGRKMFGYDHDEEIQINPTEHTHPEDLTSVLTALSSLITNPGNIPTVEYRFRHKNGSWRWLESTFTNLLHLDSVEAIVINFRDITDRKQALETLHQLNERFTIATHAAHLAVWDWDIQNNILIWDDQMYALYGIRREDFSSSYDAWLSGLHPEDRARSDAAVQQALAADGAFDTEFRVIWPDGSIHYLKAYGQVLFGEDGTPLRMTGINYDITQARQAEFALHEKVIALQTLGDIQREISAASESITILNLLCHRLTDLIHVPKAAIVVRDVSSRMQLSAQHGLADPSLVESEFVMQWNQGFFPPENIQRHTVAIAEIPEDHPIMPAFRAREHIQSLAISPLYNGGLMTGALVVFDTRPHAWTHDELQMLDLLAGQAAIALEKIQLHNQEKQRRAELTALYHLSEKLGESNDFDEVMKIVVQSSVDLLHVTFARILLLEENEFVVFAHHPRRELPIDIRPVSLPVREMPYTYGRLTEPDVLVIENDLTSMSEQERNFMLLDQVKSLCIVPLKIRNIPLGVLVLGEARNQSRESINEHKLRLATSIGEQTSSAIQRTQLHKQTEQRLRRLQALTTIDQAISSSFDLRLVLNILTQQAQQQLEIDCVVAHLFDPIEHKLEYVAGAGLLTEEIANYKPALGEGMVGWIALHQQMRLEPDVTLTVDLKRKPMILKEGFVSYCGVPLIAKGKLVGVLESFHRLPFRFTQEWVGFYKTLAGQAAIAIDNAQLFESLQRSNLELERRVAERTSELNQTNAELERANRAKDEFLATMSHELRTPLNSILGLSESLLEQRRGSLNEHQERSLLLIQSSGSHLLDLINDILDLSKIEAGKSDYNPQPVLVDEVCRSSLGFIKSQAARKSITIEYKNDTSVSKIFADPRRLKQILVNLLTNAVKFTPDSGQVTLQVHANPEEDRIQFTVLDTGIGIAEKDLRRLFQPFVQIDSNLNREFAGTGLGLYLLQKLVDMHGGSVQVESAVGKGSCFTVNLPWGRELFRDPVPPPKLAELSFPEGMEEDTAPPSEGNRKGRILLAEDNLASILTISEYLESYGYEVRIAQDGLEATQLAEEVHPDLILMDIQMPVLDGLEVIRRLRRVPRFQGTPIIALTALAMPGDRSLCIEAGADDYMSKPVHLRKLLETINELLASKA